MHGYTKVLVKDLQVRLKMRRLPVSGIKRGLIERLNLYDKNAKGSSTQLQNNVLRASMMRGVIASEADINFEKLSIEFLNRAGVVVM